MWRLFSWNVCGQLCSSMFNINYFKMFPFNCMVKVLLNCIASYGVVLLFFNLTLLNMIAVDKVIEISVSVLRNAVQQQHKLLPPKWPFRLNKHLFQQKVCLIVFADIEFIAGQLYPKNWTLCFQCRTTAVTVWFSPCMHQLETSDLVLCSHVRDVYVGCVQRWCLNKETQSSAQQGVGSDDNKFSPLGRHGIRAHRWMLGVEVWLMKHHEQLQQSYSTAFSSVFRSFT